MDHIKIEEFELAAFLADESDNAVALIAHPKERDEFMLAFPVVAAAELHGQLGAALESIGQQRGKPVPSPRIPERVARFSVREDQTRAGEKIVLMLLQGDRTMTFFAAMPPIDARSLASELIAAADRSGRGPATMQ